MGTAAASGCKKRLVEDHLELVPQMIYALNRSYGQLPRQEYEDLIQTGYLALCHASKGYDGKRPFAPYARAAIRNAVFDYWKDCHRQKTMFCSLDTLLTDDEGTEAFPCPDTAASPEQELIQNEPENYLKALESKRGGMIQKGISALRLQQYGYTSEDLAKLYGVPSNRVRAWQSKAKKQLRKDQEFYALIA